MAAPAAILNILLTANTGPANAALMKTQAQLNTTAATGNKAGAAMKKAFLGVGLAAAGAGVALYKVGEAFDDAYDSIRVQTGATEKEMKKLKGSFRNVVRDVPADFETASKAIGGLNQRLGITGRPLEKMTKQFTELSRITDTDVESNIQAVTRAFGDWEIKTGKQAEQLDRFFRASQKSGAAVSDLAEQVVQFGAPLRQVGFTLDEATTMFAQFEKAGVNTQTMMPGLKFALRSFMEAGKDPQNALQKTFEGIADGTIKAKDAFEIFGGRATPDMIEAIQQGRFELDKMTDSIKRGDDTIRKAGRQTMDFTEQWQMFKNNAMLALEPVARRVFHKLSKEMKRVTDIMSNKKLSKGEKMDALADLVTEWMTRAINKMTELAPKIARAFVRGFLNADIWAQLLVTGWFLTKLGGKALFSGMGKTAGKWFGRAFALGAVAFAAILIWDHRREILAAAQRVADQVKDIFGMTTPAMENFLNESTNEQLKNALKNQPKGTDFYKALVQEAKDRGIQLRKVTKDTWTDVMDKTKRGSDKAAEVSKRGLDKQEGAFKRTKEKVGETTRRQADSVIGNTSSMVSAVSQGLTRLKDNTNKALTAFGVSKVAFNVAKDVSKGAKGLLGKQRGGPIDKLATGGLASVVPGHGSGDKVTMALDGRPVAKVEPREGIFVGNRNLMAAMAQANAAVPRFAGGGLVQALGPYTIPPIQYDPNHAGGNSHWHINMSTPAATVAIGKKLQGMGFMVSEHPAFGGVNFQHSATGGHYDARAIDVNSAADETRAETAAVARLLSGKGGAIAAVAQRLKRILLTGPDGPLKSMGQGALDRARKAGNAFISKQAPTVTGGFSGGMSSAGGTFNKAKLVKLWNSVNSFGNANLMAAIALAESSGNPNVTNSIGARGLWQIIPSTAAAFGLNYGKLTNPAYNAFGAGKILQGQGLGAWEAYTLGMHTKYLQKGGVLPYAGNFGGGGWVPGRVGQPMAAVVHGGEHISTPGSRGYGDDPDVRELVRQLIANQRAILKATRSERSAINAAIAAAASGQIGGRVHLSGQTPVAGSYASY